MSSYELLELLEYMPEQGALKTALRKGEYSEDQIIWRHMANRLSRIESISYVQVTRKPGDPIRMFYTKAELEEMLQDQEATEERLDDFYSIGDIIPDLPELELEAAD